MPQEFHKVLIFLKRRPGMSLEDFRHHYEHHHAPLSLKYASGLSRYMRRYITPVPNQETAQSGELEFDVITELWFEQRAIRDAVLSFGSKMQLPDDIFEDEHRLFDRTKTRYAAVTEMEFELPPEVTAQPERKG